RLPRVPGSSVGGERHPCSITTPPSSSCSPSNHILSFRLIQWGRPLHLRGAPSSGPTGNAVFYITTGGVKLLSNNHG
ncbi:hypothetical protein KUCAC02_015740, partial [Chaenocephalus aceratus]